MTDKEYMTRALQLAKLADGATSPNPMVGCVLTDSLGNIVGEGYHHKAGQPHAEVNALAAAGEKAKGAVAYVTLEPCSHYGRTGPCCKALAEAGVSKVVVACQDPNPKVAGRGIAYLQQQGIEVVCGVCEAEAQKLNEKFFCWITKKRPFISLKYAMTLDGKIASSCGDSKWITNTAARTYAHKLRMQHDAILVGIETVLKDDPELTTRLVEGKNPLRIVLDAKLRIMPDAKVLNGEAETVIFTGVETGNNKYQQLNALERVTVVQAAMQDGHISLNDVLVYLTDRDITSLLVEGGSAVHGAFFDAGYADRVYCFIAPKMIGGKHALTPIGGTGKELIADGWVLKAVEYEVIEDNFLITGTVEKGGV